MTLQDDLNFVANHYGIGSEAHRRLFSALSLLDTPGARVWLAALPGLLELGEKATPGEWFPQNEGTPGEDGVMAMEADGTIHQITRNFVCAEPDTSLIVALRNALHAAAVAGKEGGGE